MHKAALLALIPTVFGCANPNSDSCASFIKSNAATASPFCATFTLSKVTATTGLPSWATACSSKPNHISKECSCYYTGSGSSPTTTITPTTMVTSTTTTSAASGTASNGGSCGSAAIDQVVGYASGVTGGGSGSGTTVTSCSALASAIASGGVIKISGILSGCGILELRSDTTILGVGSNSGMTGGGFRIKDASNVILRNLKIYLAPQSKDLISLDGATMVWVDHCDLSNDLSHHKDYYDGLLDITHASDYVTVSWTKFHDHFKGSLIGNSDKNGAEDTGHLHVTYHHNYFNKVNSRLPSIRFGTGHIYSSCYEDNPTSGVNSRMGAKVLVESNYFLNTPRAIITNLDSDQDGYAVEMNNIFVNSDIGITQSSALSPPYSYTTDPASCICDWVKAKAGVGIVG